MLNPKQVRKLKDSYSDLPKNDWVDTFVIAGLLRFSRTGKEACMDDYRYKSLQTLTRARFDVVQNLTREKQHFANYLFLKCSGMAVSIATMRALEKQIKVLDKAIEQQFQIIPNTLTSIPDFRYYLLEAANSVRRCDFEFRRCYDLNSSRSISSGINVHSL